MIKDIKQLLPIGSVVRLSGAKKSIMIFGVCQTHQETQKTYDYIGVVWPEGNMGAETQIMFFHDDIGEVISRGYESEERTDFIERLDAYYAHNR